MKVRKGFAGVAAAVLALGSFAYADDSSALSSPTDFSLSTPVLAQSSPPTKPLTSALDAAGVKNLPFTIGGYVEGGYEYDASSPHGGARTAPTGLFYDGYKDRVVLDQADIFLDRTANVTSNAWDWGFHIEGGYGVDYTYVHGNGIASFNPPLIGGGTGPNNQYDLLQAYFDIAIPVGNGLKIRGGKFFTLLGYEGFTPTGNQFYSHSYLYNYAEPTTQTGVLAYYSINSAISITAGFTRGWNQATNDNNGAIDFLGQVAWTIDPKTNININLSEGPQGFHNNSDYWTVLDVNGSYKFSDQLTLSADAGYGDVPGGVASGAAQFYGLALYAGYAINSMFTLNGRVEFYDDNNGFTVAGIRNNYYEATAGVAITPLPNDAIFQFLTVRPEVRYDYAEHPVYGVGSADRNQLSFAVDAIMQF
jgi:hypothetical protein